ncbi:transcriptional regulator [Nocardia donostiensis]|uniref:transcriptional regulator n=1 Tax=Nocardia donostiensis TaxID=1538463 RepID=UPI001115A6E9|nr:transcriptional regulator [Nocardia donostiensis]
MVGRQAGSGSGPLETKLAQHLRRRGRTAPRGDVAGMVRHCLAEAAAALEPNTSRPSTVRATISGAAERWAHEGVALETVLGACYENVRAGLDYLAEQADTTASPQELLDGTRFLVRVVEMVTVAASSAYLDEHRRVAKEHQTAAQTLVSALLSGHGIAASAKRTGITVAPAYQVVALSIPPHPDETGGGIGSVSAARRKLRRVQAALASPLGSRALSLLNADGGTVLIPLGDDVDDPAMTPTPALSADVLDMIGEAAGVLLTAAVATGPTDRIPELAGRVHDVLDHIRGAGHPPGLYRITDRTDPVAAEPARLPRIPVLETPTALRIGRSA